MTENPFAPIVLTAADGQAITIRPPTLRDQREVLAGMNGMAPDDPKAAGEVTYRMLHRCATFADEKPRTYEEFLDSVLLADLNRAGERIRGFFGVPTTSPATSTPS